MTRKESNRKTPERNILIISEDKESFIDYFKQLLLGHLGYTADNKVKPKSMGKNLRHLHFKSKKLDASRQNIKIELSHCGKTNAAGIIQNAQNEAKNYEKIYCVFDFANTKEFKEAVNRRLSANIIKIISNPSYEFWLLLHFSNSTAPIIGKELIEKLINKSVKNSGLSNFQYSKSELSEDFLDLLLDSFEKAIGNAKQVEKSHIRNGDSPNHNPSSEIYKLIEELQNLL